MHPSPEPGGKDKAKETDSCPHSITLLGREHLALPKKLLGAEMRATLQGK